MSEVKELTILVENLLKAVTTQAELQRSATTGYDPSTRGVTGITFDRFDEAVEDFDTYIDRLTAYFIVQNVPDKLKVQCFVSLIGPKLFSLLKNLLYPSSYSDKTFEDLTKLLKAHINPPPLVIPARHAFLNRKQHDGESISNYITQLRKLISTCKYNEQTMKTMLRDVFVSGLRSKAILDRLFEEDDISLEKTIELALAMEKATIGTYEILQPSSSPTVNKISMQNQFKLSSNNKNVKFQQQNNAKPNKYPNLKCLRCGKLSHTANNCNAKDLFCNFCKKHNHVYEVCLKRQKSFSRSTSKPKTVKKIYSCTVNDCQETIPLSNLQTKEVPPPVIVNIGINGHMVPMELDTGSGATVISIDKLKHIPKLGNGKIIPSNSIFRCYGNTIIKPLGEIYVKVTYKNICKNLRLFVGKEESTSIVGRDWISTLNILPSFTNVNQIKHTDINSILGNYSNLFKENTGVAKNFTYNIELKPDVSPVFKRARPVPFSLQSRVEDELLRLENENIITKVSFSDWATPVVPVVKPNGAIRLCADYSVTVNPNIKVPQHPFPGFEEIFSKLSGGQLFTTLDIRTAFLHIPTSKASSKILTINTHKGLYNVNRLMYGISAAPAVWQNYIEHVIGEIPGVCVVHDDIIITGANTEEHLNRLKNVLEKLDDNDIRLNKEKCKFLREEVTYLGYVINRDGLRKTSEKNDAILNCKTPVDKRDVKSFLGMVTFYAKFVKNLSTIAEPLYRLLRQDVKFKWTAEEQRSFKEIKQEIVSDRVLVHYRPDFRWFYLLMRHQSD